jgi:hypothetical protein
VQEVSLEPVQGLVPVLCLALWEFLAQVLLVLRVLFQALVDRLLAVFEVVFGEL